MFGLFYGSFSFFFPSLSFVQQKQQLSTSHRRRRPENKRRKTIHYLAQQPRVQIVHSVLRHSGRKCAVNAGKQRDWRVTNNERHLGGLGRGGGGAGTMMAWGGEGVQWEGATFPTTANQLWRSERNLCVHCGRLRIFLKNGSRGKNLQQRAKTRGRRKWLQICSDKWINWGSYCLSFKAKRSKAAPVDPGKLWCTLSQCYIFNIK